MTASRRARWRWIPAHFAVRAEAARSGRQLRTVEDRQDCRVGQIGANIGDDLCRSESASRVDAIGQQDDEHLELGIDPHRRSGEPSVTVISCPQCPDRTVIYHYSI